MDFVRNSNAKVFIFLNAFLWGSSYVWSKLLLDYLPRFTILFLCSFGGLLTTLIIFFPSIRKIKANEIFPSLIVAGFSICSNTFFMLALQNTSSSNAAFIVQSSVVITPIIMAISEKQIPGFKVLVCALTAIAGIFLVTCSYNDFRLNPGDIFAFMNAIFFSLFLTGQRKISSKVNSVRFSFLFQCFNSIIFFVLASVLEFSHISIEELGTYRVVLPVIASIFIAVSTVLFQSAAIRFVRPETAIIIYTLEPITTLVLAFLVIGEKLEGIKSIVGFILIISSVLLSVISFKEKKKQVKALSAYMKSA